ncbi:MAG: hypothetical protein B6U89_07030 [Desulfurococcales archaeon ex4484_58]|nr:MAG: hypothetical protein B6U89_07030 [Desulfurococcales archaeon ex4484_58]
MVSTIVVHLVGFTTLMIILFMVIGYVGINTYMLIAENEEENLEKIVNSLALQLRYILKIKTNFSLTLRYPLEVIYGRQYNILIGSGEAIMNRYSFIRELDNNTIYVIAVDLSNYMYRSAIIAVNSTSKPLLLSEDPKIFGSGTVTVVEKIIYNNCIYLNIIVKGVRIG